MADEDKKLNQANQAQVKGGKLIGKIEKAEIDESQPAPWWVKLLRKRIVEGDVIQEGDKIRFNPKNKNDFSQGEFEMGSDKKIAAANNQNKLDQAEDQIDDQEEQIPLEMQDDQAALDNQDFNDQSSVPESTPSAVSPKRSSQQVSPPASAAGSKQPSQGLRTAKPQPQENIADTQKPQSSVPQGGQAGPNLEAPFQDKEEEGLNGSNEVVESNPDDPEVQPSLAENKEETDKQDDQNLPDTEETEQDKTQTQTDNQPEAEPSLADTMAAEKVQAGGEHALTEDEQKTGDEKAEASDADQAGAETETEEANPETESQTDSLYTDDVESEPNPYTEQEDELDGAEEDQQPDEPSAEDSTGGEIDEDAEDKTDQEESSNEQTQDDNEDEDVDTDSDILDEEGQEKASSALGKLKQKAQDLKQKITEAKAAAVGGINKATKTALKYCWGGLLPSFGFSLLYITLHGFLYLVGFKKLFCKFGEEWLPSDLGVKKIGSWITILEIIAFIISWVIWAECIALVGIVISILAYANMHPLEFLKQIPDIAWDLIKEAVGGIME